MSSIPMLSSATVTQVQNPGALTISPRVPSSAVYTPRGVSSGDGVTMLSQYSSSVPGGVLSSQLPSATASPQPWMHSMPSLSPMTLSQATLSVTPQGFTISPRMPASAGVSLTTSSAVTTASGETPGVMSGTLPATSSGRPNSPSHAPGPRNRRVAPGKDRSVSMALVNAHPEWAEELAKAQDDAAAHPSTMPAPQAPSAAPAQESCKRYPVPAAPASLVGSGDPLALWKAMTGSDRHSFQSASAGAGVPTGAKRDESAVLPTALQAPFYSSNQAFASFPNLASIPPPAIPTPCEAASSAYTPALPPPSLTLPPDDNRPEVMSTDTTMLMPGAVGVTATSALSSTLTPPNLLVSSPSPAAAESSTFLAAGSTYGPMSPPPLHHSTVP